jgi:hypothetical protein
MHPNLYVFTAVYVLSHLLQNNTVLLRSEYQIHKKERKKERNIRTCKNLLYNERNTLRNKPNNIQNGTEKSRRENPQNKGRPVIRERHMYKTMTR